MKQIVIMADIIKSRSKNSNSLMSNLKETVTAINKKFKRQIKSPLTITLGDEFQGIVTDLKSALEILLYVEEAFVHNQYNFKLRYVIMEGVIDTMINNKRAFEMLGDGLTRARENLALLKDTNKRFFISVDHQIVTEILNDAFTVYQSITDGWKLATDYEIVSNFLIYQDYKKVAEVTNRNRSLMWKREKTLNLGSYHAIKNIINTSAKI